MKILVDSNIPFIAAGQIGEAWAVVILEQIIRQNIEGMTDVLYLQELLDRSACLDEDFWGKKLFACCRRIFRKTLSITVRDFDLSSELHRQYNDASPRDLFHAAVALNNNVNEVFSIDGTCFDMITGLNRTNINKLLASLNIQGTYTYERTNIFRSESV